MVADVYSHIIDDDRRLNAERMEAACYSGREIFLPVPALVSRSTRTRTDSKMCIRDSTTAIYPIFFHHVP